MQTITLNDGVRIPAIGFGTFAIPADGSTKRAVLQALEAGYRHIDTACAYFNEQEVGEAVRESGLPRDEVFVTTKIWLQDHVFGLARKAIDTSLSKLGLDYIDLYLIHQPYFDVPGTWRAMEEAKAAGKIRSIGVSNMSPKIWNRFVPQLSTLPSVNQVEFNPYQQQREIRALMGEASVALECDMPLGHGNNELLHDPVIAALAAKYGRDAGQVILRFINQEGGIVFPKSTNPTRIKSNLDIFDFELTADEMDAMRALDRSKGLHDSDAPGTAEALLAAFDVHAGK